MRIHWYGLVAMLPLALVGCGGGSSGGGSGPTSTVVVAVTTGDGQAATNVVLTYGSVFSSDGHVSKNTRSIQQSEHDDGLVDSDTITIEYNGPAPVIPSSSPNLIFGTFTPVQCSDPQSSSDQCIQGTISFHPSSSTDSKTESYFDGKLKVSGYVPFRMFATSPPTSFSIAGTPSRPHVRFKMTTVDPDSGLQFNSTLMPTTASFSSSEISPATRHDSIPFSLSLESDGTTLDVNYDYTVFSDTPKLSDSLSDMSDFGSIPYIKTYADSAKLSYQSLQPQGITAQDSVTHLPVAIQFTRAFVITTDKGEAYVMGNPTQAPVENDPSTQLMEMVYTFRDTENSPLTGFTNGSSISDLQVPYRFVQDVSLNADFISPYLGVDPAVTASSPESALLSPDGNYSPSGMITDADHDINMFAYLTGKQTDTGEKNFVARTRFRIPQSASGEEQSDWTASLVPTGNTQAPFYAFTMIDNEAMIPDYSMELSFLPEMAPITMVMTTLDDGTGAWVTISGFNLSTHKIEVYRFLLDISVDDMNEKNNSSIIPPVGSHPWIDLPSFPIPLDYITYDTSKGVTLSPEQRLVSFDSLDKTLTIQGHTPLGTTVYSTVDLSSQSTITNNSSLMAMSCSDTDVNTNKPLNNSCYILMDDTAAGNGYHMYQLSNLNVDGTGALTPTITPLTLNLSTTQGLTKAVIDNSTGALLTLSPGVSTPDNTVVYLYTLTGNSYNPGQLITLPPTTGSASDQYASNIYEY